MAIERPAAVWCKEDRQQGSDWHHRLEPSGRHGGLVQLREAVRKLRTAVLELADSFAERDAVVVPQQPAICAPNLSTSKWLSGGSF